MDRFRFGNLGKFIEEMEGEVIKLVRESRDYAKSHEEERNEIDPIIKAVGSVLLAKASSKEPRIMLAIDELVPLSYVMFWIGYYIRAIKYEVPEAFKKGMEG